MKSNILTWVTKLLIALLLAGGASAAGRVFRAGAATSNITPPLVEGIAGNFEVPPATYVHDELHARSLVLDDRATKLVFVVVDSVSVNREVFDEAKRRIHAATQIPPGRMMVSATHTHSATSARGPNASRPCARPGIACISRQ